MNKFKKYQNLSLVLLLLAFLVFLWIVGSSLLSLKKLSKPAKVVILPTITPKILSGKLSLSPSSKKVLAGDTFNVRVFIEAEGELINASDVVLNFNPEFLEALKISTGSAFPLFPRQRIDNKQGEILLTGVQVTQARKPFEGKNLMAEIVFRAKKIGATAVVFAFEKESTLGSTIMKARSSENILGEVVNGNYKITR